MPQIAPKGQVLLAYGRLWLYRQHSNNLLHLHGAVSG